MTFRRKSVIATTVLTLACALVGTGVALGSSKNHPARNSAGSIVAHSSKTKPIVCKAQACAHVYSNSTFDAFSNVVGVTEEAAGFFCVQISPKLGVNEETGANLTIDYANSPDGLVIAAEGSTDDCLVDNIPNAIAVRTFHYTGATFVASDEAFWLTIP